MIGLAVDSDKIKHQLYSEVVMRLVVGWDKIKHQLYSEVLIRLAVDSDKIKHQLYSEIVGSDEVGCRVVQYKTPALLRGSR